MRDPLSSSTTPNLRPEPSQQRSGKWVLVAILTVAAVLRVSILASGAVPFNADEAVVGLMAKHTVEGEWPLFFYGQSYMGSLDASIIAVAFALLGEAVWVMRLVQSLLFLGIVVTTYGLGMRFFQNQWTASAGALLIAIPTVLVSTYTSATLGGYGEILILGNCVLWIGHTLLTNRGDERVQWVALGIVAGLGFWTSALMVVYLLPIGVWIIIRWLSPARAPGGGDVASGKPNWRQVTLAAVGFIVGSGPWWWQNITQNGSALRFMLTGQESSGIGIGAVAFSTRLAGMAFLGLPTLLGMRFPWSASYFFLPLAIPVLMMSIAALGWSLTRAMHKREVANQLLLGVFASFALLFLVSRFGTDATGRYFLPLVVPLAMLTANLLNRVREKHPGWAALGLVYLLGFNLLGNGLAVAQNPPGLTTQFDSSNRFDNTHDNELIAFLTDQGVTTGYSNYFVSFRIAFLSDESVILSSQLPYKPDLSYNPADDRYPPYSDRVKDAGEVVYVTSIHPSLDELLAERLLDAGVGFSEAQIGPYHIFFELSNKITPQELGFGKP